MEVKKSFSDRKASLKQVTEKYKNAIENQVGDLKENAGKIGRNAMVIGGVLVVGYLVARLIAGSEKKQVKIDENYHPNMPVAPVRREFGLVSLIKQQIALFLVAIAKEKLLEAIEQIRKNDTHHTRNLKS